MLEETRQQPEALARTLRDGLATLRDLRRLAKQEAEAEKAGSHVALVKPSHPHGKDLGDGESSK